MRCVLDTSVLVAGLRSSEGASYRLLGSLMTERGLDLAISVPLVLEYESTLLRMVDELTLDEAEIHNVLDFLCSIAEEHPVFYLWRPILRDPGDDMVLELAVAAGCDAIVTVNQRDFSGSERFGIEILSPGDLIRRMGDSR